MAVETSNLTKFKAYYNIPGHGLGLAIVQKCVEADESQISVQIHA